MLVGDWMSRNVVTATEDVSMIKAGRMLRERKILMSCRGERWNLPMQEFVDRGYFATRESTFDSNGEKRISFTPLITGKGQQWLVERFIREGVLRGWRHDIKKICCGSRVCDQQV